MNQLDLSCYSKKDLPNILVYIELILTVFFAIFPDERLYDKLSEL